MIRVGQKLREARIRKKLSLESVSSQTKIRASFLSYIEKGEYQKLPSAAYAHGFVRNYARFLGLPEKEILALFRREFDEEKIFRVLPESLTQGNNYSSPRFRPRQTVIFIICIFVAILGFILYQYRFAFLNPPLSISSPKAEEKIFSSRINITGKTDPDSTVFVDTDAVSVNKDGTFKKIMTVFPGKTTITIKAINRFGRETVLEREVDVDLGT